MENGKELKGGLLNFGVETVVYLGESARFFIP